MLSKRLWSGVGFPGAIGALVVSLGFLLLTLAPTETVWAADVSIGGIDVSINGKGSSDTASADSSEAEDVSSAFQILALLTILSLAPAILIVLTSFTRIIIVLAMLRHAFGMPETPPNTVLISLALFLTLFTMMPVLDKIDDSALQGYRSGELTTAEAAEAAMIPMREFMLKQTREKDLAVVLDLAKKERPETLEDIENTVLIPAFMLSELQTAFQIGFVIFLPFLAIDIIAASVLMSMGMIMVPPITISLPIKVLMFVLIEGWVLVTQALVGSFHL